MFGVTGAHFGADEFPGAGPEAGEVAGDLDGAAGRGEQFDTQRDAVFADGGVDIYGIKFLNDDSGIFLSIR